MELSQHEPEAKLLGVRVLGFCVILAGIPSLFFALIALISGTAGVRMGPIEQFLNVFMRILWIGTPGVLFASGVGLMSYKKWAHFLARVAGSVLCLESLIYGGLGFQYPWSQNGGFILMCFTLAILCFLPVVYLNSAKVRKSFGA